MKLRHLLAGTVVVLALPLVAHAETPGFYVGVGGGLNIAPDAKTKDGINSAHVGYDLGNAALLNLGYGFGNGLRTEIEGGYHRNAVSGVSGSSYQVQPIEGETQTWSVMTNVLYDVATGTRFTPYVGAGIGVGLPSSRLLDVNGGAVYDGASDPRFAWQGIVGTAYSLTNNLSLTADYRYFATTNAWFGSDSGGGSSLENGNHVVTAGLRWNFGAVSLSPPMMEPAAVPLPEARPAPRPAPHVATDYLVFFDWNQTAITREARQIISDAAGAAGRMKPVTIVVTGHTDTSGTPTYNQALSERRAEAVKNELVLRGIDPKRIRTQGKAANDLMVPTGQGVREPSNRRAQVVLRVG